MAAWLGIVGIGAQAALPLFLAFAIASADRIGIEHAQYAHCVLCQGHHAGPVTLPAAIAVRAPRGERRAHAPDATGALYVLGSPAAYTSRAPPSTV
jgi:hypothetical protein